MMLLLLFAAHALCDYPLQGDFLARGKNHRLPLPCVPWYQCLFAHALIHAGAVAVITRNPVLGVLELVSHLVIDYGKCSEWYGFNEDQAFHYACKVAWFLVMVLGKR